MNDPADSLDIWLIRVLRTLLLERSVTQTAQRLNQTQPAISTALRRLREILNDPILVRGKQGMVPTEYGESLLAPAQRALREVEFVATPHGDFDPQSSRRTFRVAAPDYLNDFFMPTLVAAFRDAAPNARLEIESLNPMRDHERMLDGGEIDLMVANWTKPEPRFERQDLFSDVFVCLMRANHPLAREPLTAERYALAAHLAPTPYSGGRRHPIDIGLARAGIERRIVTTIPYFGLVPQVLLQSDLIFTAPRRFAQHYAAMLPLAVLDSPVPFPRIKCYQLSVPQPDQPTDIAWLRTLMSTVSDSLTGRKQVAAAASGDETAELGEAAK
ncbi:MULTISPECIES: LysR family transcriptional regulator [unclassified Caballeronia]|uniref:LysR family transcriptional regulator n=1 Tax=unclassified Caballeronia TaxID=2646786 RepID=UPI0020295760|nr:MULTISPECIES: LysR family transcriptional regulator [unclassified Caballeronia]